MSMLINLMRNELICLLISPLIHCGRVTHICVSKLTIIGSDNGLSPERRHAIIWTNAGLLLIGPLGTNFSEILIKFLTFSFKKMRLKVSSSKRRPCCLGLNVLAQITTCCRMAPVHYLNQCWLIMSKVQWHSAEVNITRDASAISH